MLIDDKTSSDVHYRSAAQPDLAAIAELFLTTSGSSWSPEFARAGHEHILNTGILRVAERIDRIVSVAGAIIRDRVWYLSSFWTHPEHQRSGIGMPLLREVWNAGQAAGAEVFFTWSSSDPAAMASYLKLGMRPGYQILHFTGEPTKVSPGAGAEYEAAVLDPANAARLDDDIRGCTRESDHAYFLGRSDMRGRQLRRNGELAGYFYVTDDGNIGPLAWTNHEHARAIMTLACHEAAAGNPSVSMAVPGANEAALTFALEAGLGFARFNHFLTTSDFGMLDHYLPSGPVLF